MKPLNPRSAAGALGSWFKMFWMFETGKCLLGLELLVGLLPLPDEHAARIVIVAMNSVAFLHHVG